MQQLWYSIKKVQATDFYEFPLANKKCVVNADVFRTILDICPRVEGVNFTDVPAHQHVCGSYVSAMENSGSYNQEKTIDVFEESEPEPEPVKRKTSSKRRVKKKVTLSTDDNIIFDDPNTALGLGKSISQTEAKEAEAARQVHATHARIVIEFVLNLTKTRKSGKVTFDLAKKLKGAPSLTPEEQKAEDIMQALKESKKTSKRRPCTEGSSEGTGTKPGVPDEFTVVSATSSERNEQESEHSEEDKLDDEEKDEKGGDSDNEDDETESDEDDIYNYKIRVRKHEDEDMINAKVDDFDKGNEEIIDAAKTDVEKTSEVNTVKDTTNSKFNSLLKVKIQFDVPHTQSQSMLSVPVSVISEPLILTPVQESPLIDTVTTLPPPSVSTTPFVHQQTTTPIPIPTITTDALIITTIISESDALSAIQLRVAKLEKDVFDLKKIDLSAKAFTRQLFKNDDDDDEDPAAGPNQGKQTKRRRTKEYESSKKPSFTKETPKGKAPTKGSKTGKFSSAKEPVEEPIAEVVMDDAGDDVAHDDNQPQDTSEPKTRKTLNPECFNIKLEYNFQECFNTLIDKLEWNNLERDHDLFDLSKPLPLQGPSGHQTVAIDYFFNNDLEYLKTSNLKLTYTTSITKTKATRVKKLHGYGHLEEIMVKRADRQLYKFKEGDFVDLHMNNIEDMLLLAVQHKLFHLTKKSYQKKLNITHPQQTVLEIKFKEPYPPSHKPPGVIYEDLVQQKLGMRADELYKFLDGMLKKVRDELHHRVIDFDLGYNKEMERRKWTTTDKKRSAIMVELIDKQMRKRMIILNLERLVCAQELEMDYKMMTHTI
nr:hypothetical protein [Tanacetum cinerariifolium]